MTSPSRIDVYTEPTPEERRDARIRLAMVQAQALYGPAIATVKCRCGLMLEIGPGDPLDLDAHFAPGGPHERDVAARLERLRDDLRAFYRQPPADVGPLDVPSPHEAEEAVAWQAELIERGDGYDPKE